MGKKLTLGLFLIGCPIIFFITKKIIYQDCINKQVIEQHFMWRLYEEMSRKDKDSYVIDITKELVIESQEERIRSCIRYYEYFD